MIIIYDDETKHKWSTFNNYKQNALVHRESSQKIIILIIYEFIFLKNTIYK